MKHGSPSLSDLDALALPLIDQTVMRAFIDEKGLILEANERFHHALGQPDGALRGELISRFFEGEAAENLLSRILHDLHSAGRWRGEICFKTPGAHKSWSEATLVALPSQDSSTRPFLYLGFDVTERKTIEQALADSQKFSEVLMREAPIAILMADADGNCIYINDQWTQLTGRRLKHALGRRWFEGVHPEDQSSVEQLWLETLTSGKAFQLEYRYLHSDGSVRWALASTIRISAKDDTKSLYLQCERDLTELKKRQQTIDLQQARIQASAKLHSLGELAAGVAHEINNPLTIVLGMTERLKRISAAPATDLSREGIAKTVDSIDATVQRMVGVTRALLILANEDEQEALAPVSIAALVRSALDLCEQRLKQHGIALQLENMSPDLFAFCRPVRTTQILSSLLSNAFDAVCQADVRWIKIACMPAEDSLCLHVSDSGQGLDPSLKEKIFEPFFTTKDPNKGMGLGLSLGKSNSIAQGGDLRLNEEAQNTCFDLILRRHISAKTTTKAS